MRRAAPLILAGLVRRRPDQGPIVAMIENYRSGLVWRIMRNNDYIRRGLERAGFEGGWLQKNP